MALTFIRTSRTGTLTGGLVETFPMIIRQIYVKNFGCILDEKLDCEPLTALGWTFAPSFLKWLSPG
jgi:hypothetical protein